MIQPFTVESCFREILSYADVLYQPLMWAPVIFNAARRKRELTLGLREFTMGQQKCNIQMV